MQKQEPVQLKREVGVWGLSLSAINLTIGAGIFVLPAIVAEQLGAASFMAYLFCAGLIILIMLCFAEIGSKITSTGGAAAYVDAAFGSFAGFVISTLFWFGYCIAADAAVANALFDLIKNTHPIFTHTASKYFFFILIFGVFAYINIKGVKSGIRFIMIITVLKIVSLLLLIGVGVFHLNSENLVLHSFPTFKTIGETSLLLLFAFFGAETALSISGEIKQPNKTIPKAIFICIASVVLIYLLIQFVAQGVLGADLMLHKDKPLLAVALKLVGPIGGIIILIATIISMIGLLSGDVLASSRILFAAAEKKMLPSFLGKLHPKFATPIWSIIVYCILTIAFAVSGNFSSLALMASASILVIYLTVVLAVIKLRFVKREVEAATFKIPFGLTIPLLAIGIIIWFLSNLKFSEFKTLLIFILIIIFYYFLVKGISYIKKRATI